MPDLSQAPSGFGWRAIPEAALAFLVPEGWFYKVEHYDKVDGYFVTKENIDADPNAQFSIGMSIYVQQVSNDSAADPAVAYAQGVIDGLTNADTTTQVVSSTQSEQGNLVTNQLQIEAEYLNAAANDPNRKKTIYYETIAHKDTNIAYLLSFESPTALWDEEWQKGQLISQIAVLPPTLMLVEHAAPEPAPIGVPGAAVSQYFQTTGGGFNTDSSQWTVSYFVTLDVLADLPDEAYVEAYFQSPANPALAILVALPGPQPKQLNLASPSISGLKCQNYWVDIHIYSSPDKSTELGQHIQWINSSFDLDKVQAIVDLTDSRTCSS